jgi:FlaG/FlaF family flagellin (archaellin)
MQFKRSTKRTAIATIIATIIVVAMTIVAAGLLYTYFTTTSTRAQNTAQIQVSASIAECITTQAMIGPPGPPGPGNGQCTGIAVITVTNSGSIALTGLTLGGSIVPSTQPTWNPDPTSAPLAPGVSTSTSFNTAIQVTSGVEYTITIVATFANGATQTQVVTVTAQ